MERLDGPFSLAALPYSQMNELLSRSGDRMYSRPNDPPPPPPLMHPLGEIKAPSVIRWDPLVRLPLSRLPSSDRYLVVFREGLFVFATCQERRSQQRCVEIGGKVVVSWTTAYLNVLGGGGYYGLFLCCVCD